LLLQTDQYNAALETLEEIQQTVPISKNSRGHRFAQAYVLYRLHREDEAKEVLSATSDVADDDRGFKHLTAQLVSLFFQKPSFQPSFLTQGTPIDH
jgi:signal recognition particle subunit SRP72